MTVRGTGVKGFAKGRAFVVKDTGQRNPFEDIPPGSILVAKSISLSDSALIDFRNVKGIVSEEEDHEGQINVLASGLGIPAIVGVGEFAKEIVNGDRLLIQNFDLIVNPDLETVNNFEQLRSASSDQLTLDM